MKAKDKIKSVIHHAKEAVQNLADAPKLKMKGELSCSIKRADGTVEDRGIISRRVVTQAFGEELADHLDSNTATVVNNYNQHSVGSDATAAASTQTALVAESTSGYGATRAAGTQTSADPRVYQSQATLNFTTTQTIREHGVFNNATFGAGTMMDRSVVSPEINVNNGDAVTFTFRLTTVA